MAKYLAPKSWTMMQGFYPSHQRKSTMIIHHTKVSTRILVLLWEGELKSIFVLISIQNNTQAKSRLKSKLKTK